MGVKTGAKTMTDYQNFSLSLSQDQLFGTLLGVFASYGRTAYSYAFGIYLVDLEANFSKFVALWNEAIGLLAAMNNTPYFESAALQSLADNYQIPLTFAVDGTVSINV